MYILTKTGLGATPLLCDTGEKLSFRGKKNRKYIGKSCGKPLPIFFKSLMLIYKKEIG